MIDGGGGKGKLGGPAAAADMDISVHASLTRARFGESGPRLREKQLRFCATRLRAMWR